MMWGRNRVGGTMGCVACNYRSLAGQWLWCAILKSRCSLKTQPAPLLPSATWLLAAGWAMSSGRLGNVKSQIKHRALKSHEAPVMRKVMGFGVWACLAGRQQPTVTLSTSSSSWYVYMWESWKEKRGESVCIFDFSNPGFRGIHQTPTMQNWWVGQHSSRYTQPKSSQVTLRHKS